LLVRGQHGDRVAAIRLRLIAQPVHGRTHLIEPLAHLRSRSRVWPSARKPTLGTHRIHLRPE
jgi:hypothetical protein